MAFCNRCNENIIWKQSKKGKWYSVNEDNTFHSYTCSGTKGQNHELEQLKISKVPTVTTADEILEEQKVSDAKTYVDQLSNRLTKFDLELIVKEKRSF